MDKRAIFPGKLAALSAAGAADRGDAGLLLLAGAAGAPAVGAGAGRLRPLHALRLVRQLREAAARPHLPSFDRGDGGVQRRGGVPGARALAAAGGDGRSRGPRRRRLQDAADLALCGGAGGLRRALGLPASIPPSASVDVFPAPARHRLELHPERQPGAAAGGDRRDLEPDQLQLPLLPGRAAVDPEVPHRGGGASTAPGPAAASGASCFRCSRRPASSC